MTAPAPSAEPLRDCPTCGTAVGTEWEFCPECGTFLDWPEMRGLLLVPDEPEDHEPQEVVPATATPSTVELTPYVIAAEQASAEARRAQNAAARAVVKWESAQRRGAAAEERAERLAAEIPLVRRRAAKASRALSRASAAVEQAQLALGSDARPLAARGQQAADRQHAAEKAVETARTELEELPSGTRAARRAQAQERLLIAEAEHKRARQAVRRAQAAGGAAEARSSALHKVVADAEQAQAAAALSAQEAEAAAATLDAVLAGARAEVAAAPEVVAAADRRQHDAHQRAQEALAAAEHAEAALVLRRKLAALRATPRSVVLAEEGPMTYDGVAPHVAKTLRESGVELAQAELMAEQAMEAGKAATAAIRRDADKAERRARKASVAADQRRSEAEVESDTAEMSGLETAEGTATRAADTAEQALATALVVGQPDPVEPVVARAEPRALVPTGERRVRRSAVIPRPEPLANGSLLCPSCGSGNAEARTLCRSCGALLRRVRPTPPPPPPTRWERLLLWLGFRHPPAQVLPAGTRPVAGGNPATELELRRARVGGRSALRSPVRAGLPAALLAALVLAIVGTPVGAWVVHEIRHSSDAVSDAVLRPRALVPTSVTASSSTPRTRAAYAIDGRTSTSWQPARPDGRGAVLTLTYAKRWDLTTLTVTDSRLPGQPRVEELTVTGGGQRAVLHLRDVAGPQVLKLHLRNVAGVNIRITRVYTGTSTHLIAGIAEIKVSGRPSTARLSDLHLPRVGATLPPLPTKH